MKLQQITPYLNKYSNNKTNQAQQQKNPNFGLYLVRDVSVRRHIINTLGSENLNRVVKFLTDMGQEESLIGRFNTAIHSDDGLMMIAGDFNPIKITNWDQLRVKPIVGTNEDGHLYVKFVDNSSCECHGTGVSRNPDKVKAFIEAANMAFRNYARIKVYEDRFGAHAPGLIHKQQ